MTSNINSGGSPGETVDIAPDVGVLGIFKFLDYDAWFAIAEYVDNAVNSALMRREVLFAIDGTDYAIRISIHLDQTGDGRLVIKDNAGGITKEDWRRALRPADRPPEGSVLSEFGMGMKTASCWFGKRLTVQSTALGEPVARTAHLDFDSIIDSRTTEIQLIERPAESSEHQTVVVVEALNFIPKGQTVAKIRRHLRSIYRQYTRSGELLLSFQSSSIPEEFLVFEEIDVLNVPRWDDDSGIAVEWKKPVLVELDSGKFVTGFAALRETGSTSHAGFALFRNKRLIVGSDDETYRPREIFGASNSFIYQRLFGELEFHGFEVITTKQAFKWDDEEEEFIRKLKKNLDDDVRPLLTQALNYRRQLTRSKDVDLPTLAQETADDTTKVIERKLPESDSPRSTPVVEVPPTILPPGSESYPATRFVDVEGEQWEVTIEFSNDLAHALDWVDIADRTSRGDPAAQRKLKLRLSLRHPFTERYVGVDYENLELLVRVGAALVLAEVFSRQSGIEGAGDVRRRVNELLRDVFSK